MKFSSARAGLLDVLLGISCLSCGVPGTAWCSRCVTRVVDPCVWASGALQISATTLYRGDVAAALNAHKERGQLMLAAPLGGLLARAVMGLLSGEPAYLVPCPSSAPAIRSRGQDHALRLARAAARRLSKQGRPPTVVAPMLQVRRSVVDQVGLSSSEREENLRGAFVARSSTQSRFLDRRNGAAAAPVIIIDDITTSGATLAEAARALLAAGVPVLGAAVVSRAHPYLGVASPAGNG